MAIYKIYPEKDATLYSAYPAMNTGLDQILEIQNTTTNNGASRILIQFPLSTIQDVLNNKVGNLPYNANLKLFVANATQLPDQYMLYAFPVSGSWQEGIGRYLYNPSNTDGVSWVQQYNGKDWATSSFNNYTTGSYPSGSNGGGNWFVLFESSQSFSINQTKDTNISVTNTIGNWDNDNLPNNGFIIKMNDDYEFNPSSSYSLKFFSRNTHTIYPPQLEIKWDDSSYVTGGLTVLSNDTTTITLGNNIGYYNTNTTYQFRVNARPTYPARQFVTQSVYTLNSALPSSSYYAIQDVDTGEYIIDFDNQYTKVSCDSSGNYFDLYMANFQPERYYKILIKSSFNDGSTVVFDNNYTFKIMK